MGNVLSFIQDALPNEWLIDFLISAAKPVIDKLVAGETLEPREIKIVQQAYISTKIWLKELVENSETTRDDKFYHAFIELCEDTAAEGGWPLPVLQE